MKLGRERRRVISPLQWDMPSVIVRSHGCKPGRSAGTCKHFGNITTSCARGGGCQIIRSWSTERVHEPLCVEAALEPNHLYTPLMCLAGMTTNYK